MPFQVSLRYRNSHICGASIISNRHCLTAAHCYQRRSAPSDYNVLVGTAGVSGRDRDSITAAVVGFIIHRQYHAKTNRNDIAILQVMGELSINNRNIAIVPLPSQNAAIPIGRTGTVSGW